MIIIIFITWKLDILAHNKHFKHNITFSDHKFIQYGNHQTPNNNAPV